MKKVISALFLMSSIGFSVGASAIELTSRDTIGPTGGGATHECALLGSQVQINLSANVNAAFNCDFATSTIRIGACHVAGSRAPRTVTCENSAATGDPAVWNAVGCATDGETITITDRVAYTASSQGGSVSTSQLNGAECNAGAVDALVSN